MVLPLNQRSISISIRCTGISAFPCLPQTICTTSMQQMRKPMKHCSAFRDRKSTRLNSSHTVIYPLSLHDALPIFYQMYRDLGIPLLATNDLHYVDATDAQAHETLLCVQRSEEHTSELQSHSDLPSFPTRRSSDLLSDVPGSRHSLACHKRSALRRCNRCASP